MTTAIENIKLTEEQQKAQEQIIQFWEDEDDLLTLGGYAGTGKTTTLAHTAMMLKSGPKDPVESIAFCSFTGRAASVLRNKLARVYEMGDQDYCGTIHRLIYQAITDEHGNIIKWQRKQELEQDLIIIDEASMVNEEIFKDLASYGVPILAVGDHGQLPPIHGKFNLMEDPKIRLEKIHRQAENNPIIKLSMMVRNGERIPLGKYGEGIFKTNDQYVIKNIKEIKDVLFLCGFNFRRVMLNSYVRKRLGYHEKTPMPGDKVICLKNNVKKDIFNGMTGILQSIEEWGEHAYKAQIMMDSDGPRQKFKGEILQKQFGQRYTLKEIDGMDPMEMRTKDVFDFGYAMTVHKAQGSEARNVVLYEERIKTMTDPEYQRWLYTGVTRASEKLIIVGE